MLIRKDTWHYRLYAFTYLQEKDKRKEVTTLCHYVWRLLLYPLPMAVLLAVAFIAAFIFFILANLSTVLTGRGWFCFGEEKDRLIPFKEVSVAGLAFAPGKLVVRIFWTIIVPGTLLWFFGSDMLSGARDLISLLPTAGLMLGVVIAFYVVYRVVMAIVYGVRHSEGWNLLKAYIKARKEGVCPLITFE